MTFQDTGLVLGCLLMLQGVVHAGTTAEHWPSCWPAAVAAVAVQLWAVWVMFFLV